MKIEVYLLSSKSSDNNLIITTKRNQAFILIDTDSKESITVSEIKFELSKRLSQRIDKITLFNFGDKALLPDNSIIKRNTSIFYSLREVSSIKLVIECYQNSIDKVTIEVDERCTVYLIKFMLSNKLDIPIAEIELMDKTKQSYLNDNDTISDNSNTSIPGSDNIHNQPAFTLRTNCDSMSRIENILLVRKGKKSFSIGLDLSFTMMRNVKKVKFDQEAPNFREVTDGVSLFCYCNNKACKIVGQMFVKNLGKISVNLGFGRINMIDELDALKCVMCSNSKKVEAKNIGFVNCEWSYKGFLTNKANSQISGDGITIDNKLYVLDEINLMKHISKLEVQVKNRSIKYKYVDSVESKNDSLDISDKEDDCDEFSLVSSRRKSVNFDQIAKTHTNAECIEQLKSEIQLDLGKKNLCLNFSDGDKKYCLIY